MILNFEETLLDSKKYKVSEFLGAGMAISYATQLIEPKQMKERQMAWGKN